MQRQTFSTDCPKSLIGRVIGKNGETVKALQFYTGTSIQVDQTTDPCRITLSGTPQSLHLATSMISDIVKGTFRGFSLLRQLLHKSSAPESQAAIAAQMVYAPGFGLIPASEFNGQSNAARGPLQLQPLGQPPAGAPVMLPGGQQVLMGGGGMGAGAGPAGAFLPGPMSPSMQGMQQQAPERGGLQGQVMPGYMGVAQLPQGALPPGFVLTNQAGQPIQQQQQLQQVPQQQQMQLMYGGQGYAVPQGMAMGMVGMQQGGVPAAAGMAGPSGMTLVSFPGMPGMLAQQQQLAAAQQQQQPAVLQQAGQQQQQQVLFSNMQAGAQQQFLMAPDAGGAPAGSAAPRQGPMVQDPGSAYSTVVAPGNQVYLYTSTSAM